ncbi:amine-terminal region of chorein, A TM vesicle-mediated sorter (macronuclear) [Tetrahymena thermophila SB210]|uniref:Amine-terminal region of chorein, A TM vesicle-mediated sorter n=1 Tax=Tetrahymena thermophila (strain SB210) TaxID=312017 RepID=Q23FV3_TETTS|nr:amine-terminal region of chorein, A TM vesicle-mediated sorter [Tetrahymena thermophila SB210]EAR95507.2 amine-terminal region of chorein, A TM vesicle-mediated sorter [Tetrahymena thermophila SB210]|eukprot:XP_001015752.2 amine-terminal region of chorein, A TM vesicle-mediated sorter [Tetrahymena thermophila SB210]
MKAAFFQYLNNKIGQYLYGFNDQQLNLGIMQGKFELRQLTLKPIEINKLIKSELNIPFQMKAGLISKISVEYGSILQISNVKVQVDELMIVLKPSYNSIKSGADYYESDELMDKLSQNYTKHEIALKASEKSIFKTFNLQKFISQIQEGLKKLGGNSSKISNNYDFVDEKKQNSKQDDKGIFEKAIEEKLKEMLEKLKISINKIHIRLEDDDISYQNPISIGLLIENLLLLPQKSEVLSVISTKAIDLNADQIQQNRESIKWLKFLQITNLTVYLKNKSEQAIPDSLLREVAYQNMGILEAIKFDDLRNFLIKQFFQSSDDLHIFKILKINLIKCNYVHTTSPKQQNNSHITTNVQMNSVNMLSSQSHLQFINSQIANMQNNYLIQMSITQPEITINKEYFITLKEITEFLKNQTYWPYLQRFKPKLRPIVQQFNNQITEVQKKVNQQIIRDWFRVVIWKLRLQKSQQEQYPDVYKKYQLTSILYSLQNPQLINQKLNMANQQQMLTIFNEILNKELNEEIEMIQNMKEAEKRSLQLLEELKESSFTIIFKINKFELYFIEKNNRFFTFFFNLLYCEFSNKYNEYIFFFDLSPICVYLHGCEKVVKANSDKKVKQDTQQESLFLGVAPFQPRSIYDKKLASDKNNYSLQYQQADLAQKKQSSRKIFDNNNNKQQIFTSLDGVPTIPVSSSLQNSQHFFSQQATRRSNNDVVQFDSLSEHYAKQAKNQDIDEFVIKEDSKYSNSQYNNSSMHSSSSPKSKKRKQIFEQDFEIQEEFFDSKSHKENKEKKKVDLNEMIMKAKDRRDLIETKTNFLIKFQTNTSKNQVNLNVQLSEIHINQDTRDIKEILNYFKGFPVRDFLNCIAECFSKRDYQKVTSIVKKANFLKYKNGSYKINSSLQIQSLLRPLANSKNRAKKELKRWSLFV